MSGRMRQKFFLVLFGVVLIMASILTACGQVSETRPEADGEQAGAGTGKGGGKLIVYASFYPLYDFAAKIAGERAEVNNLVPPGAEPHDFEPSPKDLAKLSEADVFLYNGSGFERWIEDVLRSLDASDMIVVNMSERVDLLSNGKTGHLHGGHGHADPHFWLDPLRAKQMAAAIKDALIQADGEGKETYEANYRKLAAELDRLHAEYAQAVKRAKRKEIIVSHAAFAYLADRYGLEQIAISGLSPSDEPTQKELREIISFAKEHQAKYILFASSLVNAKAAEAVREHIGAEALVLNPLEGLTKEDIAKGKDYFSVMRENLATLKKALGGE
ncbi:metal ABC transporter substrate-binding protein [Bacillaceae bacterium]